MSDLRNYLHDGDPAASVDDTRVDAGWERLSRELPPAGATPLKSPSVRRPVRSGLIAAAASVALVAGSIGTYHVLTRDAVDVTLPADAPTLDSETPELTQTTTSVTVLGHTINIVGTQPPTTGVVEYRSESSEYFFEALSLSPEDGPTPVTPKPSGLFVLTDGTAYDVVWRRNKKEASFPQDEDSTRVTAIERFTSLEKPNDDFLFMEAYWARLASSANPVATRQGTDDGKNTNSLVREVFTALFSPSVQLSGQGKADALTTLGKIPGVKARATTKGGRDVVEFAAPIAYVPSGVFRFAVDAATGQVVLDDDGKLGGTAIAHSALPPYIADLFNKAQQNGHCSKGDGPETSPSIICFIDRTENQ